MQRQGLGAAAGRPASTTGPPIGEPAAVLGRAPLARRHACATESFRCLRTGDGSRGSRWARKKAPSVRRPTAPKNLRTPLRGCTRRARRRGQWPRHRQQRQSPIAGLLRDEVTRVGPPECLVRVTRAVGPSLGDRPTRFRNIAIVLGDAKRFLTLTTTCSCPILIQVLPVRLRRPSLGCLVKALLPSGGI